MFGADEQVLQAMLFINGQIAALLVAEFVQKKRRFVQETAVDGVVLREMLVPAAVVRRERG